MHARLQIGPVHLVPEFQQHGAAQPLDGLDPGRIIARRSQQATMAKVSGVPPQVIKSVLPVPAK